jgi:hypothetical protein
MPIEDFPFFSLSPDSPPRPILFTKIVNPVSGLMVDKPAVIDTGADACAVPAYLSEELGFDLKRGKHKRISTGNGETTAYTHICRIEIYHTAKLFKGNAEIVYKMIDIPIDFMEGLPFVLLGTKDFLGQFFLRADYPLGRFSVQSPI